MYCVRVLDVPVSLCALSCGQSRWVVPVYIYIYIYVYIYIACVPYFVVRVHNEY